MEPTREVVADLQDRPEEELLLNLSTGEVTPVDPSYFIGIGPPDGHALLSSLSKLEIVAALAKQIR